MPTDIQKQLKVTFAHGLPMGTHATFTHEKQLWIAYPAPKNQRILTLIDRFCGIFTSIHKDMLRWIEDWPSDAQRVAAVLERVNTASAIYKELTMEKAEAETQ